MSKKTNDFGGSTYDKAVQMEINGLSCVLNMPNAIKVVPKYEIRLTLLNENKVFLTNEVYGGKKQFASEAEAENYAAKLREERNYSNVEVVRAEEEVAGLPPHAPRKAFKVDEYDCPTNWMHGSATESSFFVPIEAEKGLWLDFNKCNSHTHHVAVVVSVQGVNPITGQSQVEGKPLCLEKYGTKCPVHDEEFKADRFCEKCGYKWTAQNYLCTTGTPNGAFWLDGFRTEDGVVRQYYFSEEEVKGVAHQIVGPEKKVYAIGIAFYLSKTPKPVINYDILRQKTLGGSWFAPAGLCSGGPSFGVLGMCDGDAVGASLEASNYYDPNGPNKVQCNAPAGGQHTNSTKSSSKGGSPRNAKLRKVTTKSLKDDDIATFKRISLPQKPVDDGDVTTDFDPMEDADSDNEVMTKKLEIAAGAKINQKIHADPESLDFWQEKPAGFLYINYCTVEQANAILAKGKKDLTKGGEGFLAGLKVGN